MFLSLALSLLAGVVVGILTGLTPGIHLNLVALLVMSFSGVLLQYIPALPLVTFVMSMSITHTFLDALPGIYLGAPDADQALSVLPGHRLLLQGRGHQAVLYTIIGSFLAVIVSLLLFPLYLLFMDFSYPFVQPMTGVLLVGVMAWLIGREASWRKRCLALAMFLLSGTLGLLAFNIPTLSQPLFPLLSGMFGISTLLLSLQQKTTIPVQDTAAPLDISLKNTGAATAAASGVGFLAAFLPGFGSSQAAILATQVVGDIGEKGFLVLVGGINTANMLISIATVYLLEKARNGAIVAVQYLLGTVSFEVMLALLAASLAAAGLASLASVQLSKVFSSLISKVHYPALILSILCFIAVLSILFDSWLGFLLLVCSTAIGMAASILGVGKNHLMGCLILPVILYFLG